MAQEGMVIVGKNFEGNTEIQNSVLLFHRIRTGNGIMTD